MLEDYDIKEETCFQGKKEQNYTRGMEKNICCLAPSILKGAFKSFAARGNEWVKLKCTG